MILFEAVWPAYESKIQGAAADGPRRGADRGGASYKRREPLTTREARESDGKVRWAVPMLGALLLGATLKASACDPREQLLRMSGQTDWPTAPTAGFGYFLFKIEYRPRGER